MIFSLPFRIFSLPFSRNAAFSPYLLHYFTPLARKFTPLTPRRISNVFFTPYLCSRNRNTTGCGSFRFCAQRCFLFKFLTHHRVHEVFSEFYNLVIQTTEGRKNPGNTKWGVTWMHPRSFVARLLWMTMMKSSGAPPCHPERSEGSREHQGEHKWMHTRSFVAPLLWMTSGGRERKDSVRLRVTLW